MDEYNQGWDPEVRQFFRKILNSFAVGALWLLTITTLGLFLKLGYVQEGWQWYNFLFYGIFLLSFALLLLFFYRVWRKRK